MIVKDSPLPVNLPVLDLPPSYGDIISPREFISQQGSPDSDRQPEDSDVQPEDHEIQAADDNPSLSSILSASNYKSKSKSSNWLPGFGSSRSASKEVRLAVTGVVRDIVRQRQTTLSSVTLLNNCAEACKAKNISFSSLLQEQYIEDHTAIYWAIITRSSASEYDFLMAMISHSTPLTEKTLSEIRLACLHVGDSALFQILWRRVFLVVCGTDEILLGASTPPDSIEVDELPGDGGCFAARVRIVQFPKRMKITGQVSLEFLARGRIWMMKFHIIPKKGWAMTLSVLEHSPPTWLDSKLIIQEPERPAPQSASSQSEGYSNMLPMFMTRSLTASSEPPSKPSLCYLLKTNKLQLGPNKKRGYIDAITISFDKEPSGTSLQYPDSPYYDTDGTLNATLEACLLSKQEGSGCIIC